MTSQTTQKRAGAPGRDDAQRGKARRIEKRGPALAADRRVLARLRDKMGRELCDRYFERVAKVCETSEGIRVRVPSDFVAGVIDRRFGEALREATRAELGRDSLGYDVCPVGESTGDEPASVTIEPPAAKKVGPKAKRAAQRRTQQAWKTLDDFIVGPSNELAHNAAQSVARGERNFCPLFVHGACGLGKTHLLQGIASAFSKANPGAGVRYVTSEAFTNAFLTAMRAGSLDAFRETYRNVGLLCLDDVHFLSAKRATQTELLHTFDTIGMNKRLVVLASDEHPREIGKLNAALASRFMSGAVVRIEYPDQTMRVLLVRSLAERRGLLLEDAAVALIAEHAAQTNALTGQEASVRELEGLVIQIEATHRLLPDLSAGGGKIGAALASKALGLDGASRASAPVGIRKPARAERIIELTCAALGVTLEEFEGSNRHRRIVLARSVCVLLAREMTNLSYPEIARAMGRPNHSTVITAHQRIKRQIEQGEKVGTGPDLDQVTIATLAERIRRELNREAVPR